MQYNLIITHSIIIPSTTLYLRLLVVTINHPGLLNHNYRQPYSVP